MEFEIWWIWMSLATLFLVGEVTFTGSFFLWLSFGAAASGIFALLNVTLPAQIIAFVNISGILFVLERRFFERFTIKQPQEFREKKVPDNEGEVVQTINNRTKRGKIKIGNSVWRAHSETGSVIKKGTKIRLAPSDEFPGEYVVEVISHEGSSDTASQKEEAQEEMEIKDINIFRRSGAGWEIKYQGVSYSIKPSIGLLHIRNLITHNGEWLHCSELKRLVSENPADKKHLPYSNMVGEQLDGENLRRKEDIRSEDMIKQMPLKKLKELRDDLLDKKEADSFENPEKKMDMLDTLEFIEKYLASVTDNKGRSRKIADDVDADRKAVSAAINRCRDSFKMHEDLYIHFKSFIKAENNSFRYLPDRPIDWETR
ncbi:NfeD family protein [candidate division KSB1 bacterium]